MIYIMFSKKLRIINAAQAQSHCFPWYFVEHHCYIFKLMDWSYLGARYNEPCADAVPGWSRLTIGQRNSQDAMSRLAVKDTEQIE